MGKNILQTTNKRVRPSWLCPLIKKIFTLLILLLLLPVTALAVETNTVYVGGVALAGSSTSIVYATTNESGEVITEGATADNYNIKWDGSTLTLHDATIQKELYASDLPLSNIAGAAIGVINQNGNAELTIQLEGSNTIEETNQGLSMGIYVYSSGGGAALNIKGNGTLVLNSNYQTIQVISSNGNATLSIENAKVTATSSYGFGVTVRSGSSETSSASLTVDGGSLTATAQSSGVSGIRLLFGTGGTSDGTPTVTVSNNAIVRANGSAGGITSNSSTGIQYETGSDSTGGIVFDGKNGTVYGNVTLQEDLEIGEGESLTIGQDASLNTGSHEVIVNGGTLTGGDKIIGTVKYAPTITTENLPTGEVGTAYTAELKADGTAPITWSVTDGALPDGLKLENGVISGTPTAEGTSTFTVTATNDIGNDSKEYTLTIAPKPTVSVTGVSLDKGTMELYTGNTAILTATVEPGNATDKTVIWSSDNEAVATVDENCTVTAVAAGEAIIIVTTVDGGFTATCTVTVTQSIYSITADITALNFGNAYTGYTQPAAQTVTITNNGNRPQTLVQPASTNSFIVGNLSTTELAVGETATFTVQPKADLPVGTYSEDITVSGSGGATLSITASFNVREEVEVKPSGSTNLSFTTDRDEFALTAIVYGENLDRDKAKWTWSVANEDVVALSGLPTWRSHSYSINRQTFTIKGTGTTTITATYDDGIYRGSVDFTVRISKPTPPDPISYYNIYVEDVCDGVEVTLSNNVVREGNSISVYVKKDTANYTFDNFHVYYKEGYYDSWDELKEGTQPGEYPIKNIWNHIYIKAEGAEEKEDPTGIEQVEGVKVYTKDGSLYVQTPQREQVIIVSMSGAVVKNEEQVGLKQYHGLQPGIYIVWVGNKAYKLRLN